MRLLCSVLLLTAANSATAVTRVEGTAVSPANGRVLYRETHWLQGPAGAQSRLVLYRCATGDAFARKWMPVPADPQAPGFQFVDGRDGREESVDARGTQRVLAIRAQRDAALSRTTLQVPADAVIDAGFDAAVRTHWTALLDGKAVSLPFLVASRQRWVPVKVRRERAVTWQGQPAEQLQMRVDAWFGFAVPTITLVYAQADQRLLEFAGTSNVRDAQGDYPQVRVRFAGAPRASSDAELAAARQQPLVASCTG